MIVGVRIGEIDTLSEWGLCLCSDLSIGAPELKSKWVDVPAADGALDFSQALTGGPVYKNREITFRLVQADRSAGAFSDVLAALMAHCHGKSMNLWLPDDEEHYFTGLFEVDAVSGYNKPVIKIKVTAFPYRYKNNITLTVYTIPAAGSVLAQLNNELMPVYPAFAVESGSASVNGHTLTATPNTFGDIRLIAGKTGVTLTGATGAKVMITYQEGRL